MSGETFDIVARKIWGDERRAGNLMQANFAALDYLVFPAGVILNVPEDVGSNTARDTGEDTTDDAFNFREVILGESKARAGSASV